MFLLAQTPIASGAGAQRAPRAGAWLLLAPLLAWLAMFVVVPTLLLVVISFCTRDEIGRVVFRFTIENYIRAFDRTFLTIMLLSLWYAFLTAAVCLLVGYPVAWFIGRANARLRRVLILLVMIPFWISFLIRTYAWISILSTNGLLNGLLAYARIAAPPLMYTPFAVVLGLVYNYLPFAILPIFGSVEKLDASVIEAAYDLGARPWRAFVHVIIPLTRPGIVAGFLLVFVPAIAMFAITSLMGGGAVPLIGNVIQNQFTAARNPPFGAALGTLLLAVFLVAMWILMRTRSGSQSRPPKTVVLREVCGAKNL
jgi:spermidine/putrescine transport system permease protein